MQLFLPRLELEKCCFFFVVLTLRMQYLRKGAWNNLFFPLVEYIVAMAFNSNYGRRHVVWTQFVSRYFAKSLDYEWNKYYKYCFILLFCTNLSVVWEACSRLVRILLKRLRSLWQICRSETWEDVDAEKLQSEAERRLFLALAILVFVPLSSSHVTNKFPVEMWLSRRLCSCKIAPVNSIAITCDRLLVELETNTPSLESTVQTQFFCAGRGYSVLGTVQSKGRKRPCIFVDQRIGAPLWPSKLLFFPAPTIKQLLFLILFIIVARVFECFSWLRLLLIFFPDMSRSHNLPDGHSTSIQICLEYFWFCLQCISEPLKRKMQIENAKIGVFSF